jgi:pimeloyl-ACP methyl ester carboxylesterase
VSQVRPSLSIALLAVLTLGAVAVRPQPAGAHYCTKTGSVSFRAADGVRLAGHRFGRGSTAVVFAHQSRGDACQWIPYARQLGNRGYLAIAFDFRGYGDSQRNAGYTNRRLPAEVIAAAKLSRALGAKKVVLVGASMGGTAVVVAAASARPTVDGVIAVSAPSGFGYMHGVDAARKLRMPVLILAGDKDPGFADEAHTLFDATGSSDKRLEILDSPFHGVELVEHNAAVRSLIQEFVASR